MSSPLASNIIMRAGLIHPFEEMGEQGMGVGGGGVHLIKGP